MQRRKLGANLDVSAMGLGCMGMSEFYGPRDDAQAMQVLDRAIALGVDMLDTADMYGPYHNEELIGRFLASRKPDVKIATKFGIVRQAGEYRRSIDNSPEYARRSCEASLRRLGIEQIDLKGANLSAGFIDVQLNGCGGVMFNGHITTQTLATMQALHKAGYVTQGEDLCREATEAGRNLTGRLCL